MEDLIPILFQYVRSREKPGGDVLFVAHNARCFDVPFIICELRRYSIKIPPNWLFLDTLPLARHHPSFLFPIYTRKINGVPQRQMQLQKYVHTPFAVFHFIALNA